MFNSFLKDGRDIEKSTQMAKRVQPDIGPKEGSFIVGADPGCLF